ncbi:hypothetical protein PHYSODRAFT_326853 [Phytophthora sojae]|uniref:Uncharacterized protein n=1 Tax=Phytophthora sojae (strain P6497) TaxID=1094619 RepID=G4Z1H9_PHYSP|nr:hypothetical protein PHYSODRAFT_326853 [Phytophthora sojae]EGZ25890.1 hypothetical protein PHYSODRAFT_326853 [Phytophthora sojae]|eukprot:XP_009521178.1 hypothetical protein PHYSODRAFT_326853 [Phytophthora sojae]
MEAAATRREQQRPSHGGDAASADERREEMVHEDTIGGELHAAHGGKVTPADVASMTTREVSVIVGTLLNVEVANTAATPRIETMPRTRTAPNVESTPTTEQYEAGRGVDERGAGGMAEGCKEEARVEGSACILYNVDGGGPIMAPIIADDDATSIDSNYQSPSTQTRASPVASESTQRTKGTVAKAKPNSMMMNGAAKCDECERNTKMPYAVKSSNVQEQSQLGQ